MLQFKGFWFFSFWWKVTLYSAVNPGDTVCMHWCLYAWCSYICIHVCVHACIIFCEKWSLPVARAALTSQSSCLSILISEMKSVSPQALLGTLVNLYFEISPFLSSPLPFPLFSSPLLPFLLHPFPLLPFTCPPDLDIYYVFLFIQLFV